MISEKLRPFLNEIQEFHKQYYVPIYAWHTVLTSTKDKDVLELEASAFQSLMLAFQENRPEDERENNLIAAHNFLLEAARILYEKSILEIYITIKTFKGRFFRKWACFEGVSKELDIELKEFIQANKKSGSEWKKFNNINFMANIQMLIITITNYLIELWKKFNKKSQLERIKISKFYFVAGKKTPTDIIINYSDALEKGKCLKSKIDILKHEIILTKRFSIRGYFKRYFYSLCISLGIFVIIILIPPKILSIRTIILKYFQYMMP